MLSKEGWTKDEKDGKVWMNDLRIRRIILSKDEWPKDKNDSTKYGWMT